MGTWGFKAYDNDGAADWFAEFWESKDLELVASTVENFESDEEEYERIRAAAHVLTCFGSPYTAPESFMDKQQEIVQKTVDILKKLIDPESDEFFLDMWEGNEEAIDDVKNQIRQLEEYLPENE